ncbi:hypothetical protein BsWGS_18198 [Bradybaena similaris]
MLWQTLGNKFCKRRSVFTTQSNTKKMSSVRLMATYMPLVLLLNHSSPFSSFTFRFTKSGNFKTSTIVIQCMRIVSVSVQNHKLGRNLPVCPGSCQHKDFGLCQSEKQTSKSESLSATPCGLSFKCL